MEKKQVEVSTQKKGILKKTPQKTNRKVVGISKKSQEALIKGVKIFKKIIELAKQKHLNESDTSNIINDMLGEVWWYDKYFDITTEYKIKGQFCDYGVKIDNKLRMLIEVKAIWIDLNDNHIFQAISYAGNEGVKRVMLTNLREWKVYYLTFWEKIEKELILEIDFFSEKNNKLTSDCEYIHKEAFQKQMLEALREQRMALCEDNVKKVIFWKAMIDKFKSEIKKLTGMKIDDQEAVEILKSYMKFF